MAWGGRKVGELKLLVAATYGTRCYVCGKPIDMTLRYPSKWSATVEHVRPRSKGGTDELTNLRLSHFHCNSSRGAKAIIKSRRCFIDPAIEKALKTGPL